MNPLTIFEVKIINDQHDMLTIEFSGGYEGNILSFYIYLSKCKLSNATLMTTVIKEAVSTIWTTLEDEWWKEWNKK